ncbi:hypothetical protein G647_03293 [Cladophialophora carrionii CBS 160.54]|uniref:Alpha/beta hydrolase fold-3 domain-containing protein n=1 Tax=Cladophialophora carrionii CBS 160.54 TaxID=1279043 RepID=V9DIM5_9EURO|nr:uncharacterized protein G647_03293 [Cladophialophora carrionii CBS 160.54]ETI26516.1 hypothetical protein G647_03293 [Cladophialophora carrionii CBS 160.54]
MALGDAYSQDLLLAEICNSSSLVVVSVDYRLAPEHPYPAALEDCCTVAEWLVRHSREKWRCEMSFIGGESAGGTLSALVLLHLKRRGALSHIKGVVLSYGNFDLSALPSLRELGPSDAPILSYDDAENFLHAYLPGLQPDQRKAPTMSPAYDKLDGLVPALFIVGTKDGLLDDTVMMAWRWQLAGNEAIVKFVPGACHGFMTFNGHAVEVTRRGWDLMIKFLTAKLGS